MANCCHISTIITVPISIPHIQTVPICAAHVHSEFHISYPCAISTLSLLPKSVHTPSFVPMSSQNIMFNEHVKSSEYLLTCTRPVHIPSRLPMFSQYTISTVYCPYLVTIPRPTYFQLVHHIQSVEHLYCLMTS